MTDGTTAAALISAGAALGGTLVGGLVTFVTTRWIKREDRARTLELLPLGLLPNLMPMLISSPFETTRRRWAC